MSVDPRSLSRRWALASCVPLLLVAGLVACASSARGGHDAHDGVPGMPGMDHGAMAAPPGAAAGAAASDTAGTPGTGPAADGLAAERDGYRLDAATAELPAGRAVAYPFTITGPDGRPVTDFAVHQTRKLHFYAIRTDLTGFQHLHPVMAADGTWTADLTALAPGTWRMYASFVPESSARRGSEIVLSRVVKVAGESTAPVPLPAAAGSTTVDGYTVALRSEPKAGALQLTVTVTEDGRPVTDLQPYLDSYAHLTAFHEGDQALAHVHPTGGTDGDHGGPELTLYAMLGSAGNWRVFLQFQTAGRLHTAELTLHVA
ncbi:hypothetical protein [Streptomyces sp. CB01881]|uniref:hypothetical protein n=1 Tax=Streptomyces sp. CB01881 TaxID=2078691 RepID=UPI000CDCDF11|nr:hypothetical protein [Streptomyces sp. CB01881]AUY52636.1 hypothetical protein C2142_31190 [Streptomyces sp. CB01881]TYC70355.1 hypothetical protein EH183_31255 [Streptomyces sp. CB01881]